MSYTLLTNRQTNNKGNKLIDNNKQAERAQEFDYAATITAIKDAGYSVGGWCRVNGYDHSHLYRTLNGERGVIRPSARRVNEMLETLRQQGFLRFKNGF